MKTIKITSILSLLLIFGAVISAFSGNNKPASRNLSAKTIKYQVTVHLSPNLPLCNTYLIQVVDEHGILVAFPQTFVSGTAVYTFISEPGAIGISAPEGWKSKRTARLVLAGSGDILCMIDLVTPPDSKSGPFTAGQTYTFNLYPEQVGQRSLADPKSKD